jgi:hypothetical protein
VRTLDAVETPKDAISFSPQGGRLVPSFGTAEDAATGRSAEIGSPLPIVIENIQHLEERIGGRLDNQPDWVLLTRATRALPAELAAPPESVARRIRLIYEHYARLRKMLELDRALPASPTANAAPLEPEIRAALKVAEESLGRWLRQFPTVQDLERASRAVPTALAAGQDLRSRLPDAAAIARIAKEEEAVDAEGAAAILMQVETAQAAPAGSPEGELAASRAVGSARSFMLAAAHWIARATAGPRAGGEQVDASLAARLRKFLSRARASAFRLLRGLAQPVQSAFVTVLRWREAAAEPPRGPEQDGAPPDRRVEDIRELAQEPPPDFDIEEVKGMILAGKTPPAAWMPFIRELGFFRADIEDLAPLSALTSLRTLFLTLTRVGNLAPLSALTRLQTLGLAGTKVVDLSPLSALTNLEQLYLNRTRVADVGPLSTLAKLRWLDLNRTQVADLAPLSTLTSLKVLQLNGTSVTDLAPLSMLIGLEELQLGTAPVADLTPLNTLTRLQSLNLDGTQVNDITPLANLIALEWVGLAGTQVHNIAPLAALPALRWLRLGKDDAVDLSPLAQLKDLRIERVG